MKKLLTILLVVAMIFTTTACSKKPSGGDTPTPTPSEDKVSFEELCDRYFKEDISSDYLSLHFSVNDYTSLGIEKPEVTLGKVEADKTDPTYKDRLAELAKVDTATLTDSQKIVYDNMIYNYTLMQSFNETVEDYDFAFTPNSGINNNLITNLTEFDFRSEEDVQDFIILLQDSGRYIDDGIAYNQKQADLGIYQLTSSQDEIIEQCESFISKVEDNEVINAASVKIDALNLAKADEYKAEIKKAVVEILVPAYQRIIDAYKNDWYGKCTTTGAICDYKYGKDYYKALFTYETSYEVDIDKYASELENDIYQIVNNIIDVMYAMSDEEYEAYVSTAQDYGHTDYYEILEYLKKCMADEYPALQDVKYTCDLLDTTVTSDNVVAYYIIAPVDNPDQNVIKVNPNYTLNDPNTLCITLSHEGYPGHLYQTVYYNVNHADTRKIMATLKCTGYTEGWAEYVEFEAYKYFLSGNIAEIEKLYDELGYAVICYVDIAVNYLGQSESDIATFLAQFYGDEYGSMYAEYYCDLVKSEPCMFMPYGIGGVLMMKLRDYAEESLGEKFDAKAYNQVILDCGSVSYNILSEQVDKYISANK